MAHSIGGYTIYVQEDQQTDPVIAAELNVLDSTSSTVQHFSKPSTKRRLSFYIIGKTSRDAIAALSSGSAAINYTSDEGSQGNFYMLNFVSNRKRGSPVGFGGASPTDSVYVASADLIEA